MLQDSLIASVPVLHQIGGVHGLFLVGLVLLGAGAGRRIDLLQLRDGKGGFLGIFPRIIFVKIGKLRFPALQLRDNQSHLQAPVAQMDVANHFMARETAQALYALPDDRGTQMAHMEGLGHIRSAVIDDDRLRMLRLLTAQTLILLHLLQVVPDEIRRQFQVQKARIHRVHLRKHRVFRKLLRHL